MFVNISSSPAMPSRQASTEIGEGEKTENSSGLTVSSEKSATTSANEGVKEASGTQQSDTIKELKKQIEKLQKQLQQQQQALQGAQSSNQSPEAKAVAVAAAQTQMSATAAALQTMTSALLQAVNAEGGKSTGSMISTTA
ncbi:MULTISPECIES: hypothetical protein [Pseudomonas]|uniref:hypothetical protein n=1 Tax=Pseudomonas veronii TaxID=76761 RepID=UPI0015A28B8F|nr:hypothetical protein [Pseudomonas veronii]NWD58631.1 hypothetical protein [Pseudomonas veronii]